MFGKNKYFSLCFFENTQKKNNNEFCTCKKLFIYIHTHIEIYV